ncbi:hypothetical protein CSQ85_12020 [Bifidobacterium rousetti]|uniref:hypothetical protein n=1 Tax=Bifidobacterium rousetti TaxID=2045439 RepID=UPI0012398A67|nr:hypothetical protein [Bifidobacterium rousetti]KAA8816144.1 hypothetical protein CSQ85_12020 [Bifidobacterium rousetti]
MTPDEIRRSIIEARPGLREPLELVDDPTLAALWHKLERSSEGFHIDLTINGHRTPFVDISRIRLEPDNDDCGSPLLEEAHLCEDYVRKITDRTTPGTAQRTVDQDAVRRLERLRDSIDDLIHDINNETDTP